MTKIIMTSKTKDKKSEKQTKDEGVSMEVADIII